MLFFSLLCVVYLLLQSAGKRRFLLNALGVMAMTRKIFAAVGLVIIAGLGGGWFYHLKWQNGDAHQLKQVVFVGDSQEQVYKMLGDPSIEFPQGDTLVQWYTGCEVTVSNGVVMAVEMTPVETEEERMERELSIQADEKRLKSAYQTVLKQEKISYAKWLDREGARMAEDRLELAKIEAYETRRSEEKKAAIRAEAIRRSRLRCGR